MNTRIAFAYLQARCQARLSRRLDGDWERLAAVRDPGAYLAAVLRNPFHATLSALQNLTGIHETEEQLRDSFRRIVNETAVWAPPAWRQAVRWTAVLADLPVFQFLRQDGDAYGWIRNDPHLQRLVTSPAARQTLSREPRPLLTLLQSSPDSLLTLWVRHWRFLWPKPDAGTRDQLHRLEAVVLKSRRRLLDEHSLRSDGEAAVLESEFTRILRRRIQTPAAAFAYLGLSWLELARLRAGLLERRLAARPA